MRQQGGGVADAGAQRLAEGVEDDRDGEDDQGGRTATQGWVSSEGRSSSSIAPHSAVGGATPSPRKDSPAAYMMASPTSEDAYTRTTGATTGATWRRTSDPQPAPLTRAATRYSAARTRRVSVNATRATAGVSTTDSASTVAPRPGVSSEAMAIASSTPGKA